MAFSGQRFVYEPAFHEQRDACFRRFVDVGERYVPTKVVPFPQLWDRIDPVRHVDVAQWLNALAYRWERGEIELYEQGVQALASEFDVPVPDLQVVPAESVYAPPSIAHDVPPIEARALEPPMARRDPDTVRGSRLAELALAGLAGAVVGMFFSRRRL